MSAAQEYLDALDPVRRERLELIRRTIAATAPDATEDFLYGMPGFRYGKDHLACYAAAKKHDGFYPCSGGVIARLPEIRERFRTTTGAVHLPLTGPVPVDAVELLVLTRLAEIEGR